MTRADAGQHAARRVRVLPPEVANQIAAGEVVERPASVVKELIENALDAGARRVQVAIERAGSALIAVVDDGEGMSAEDAVTAFSRHATSKVGSVEDLERITTMGFRGEALASIAAVSCTTLVTRRRSDLAATRVVVRHGKVAEVWEQGAPSGTRVEVADLFGNTPARRKFLKSPATEIARVSELVTRTALGWPEVAFALHHDGRRLIELPAVGEPAERVFQVLGDERGRAMLSLGAEGDVGGVSGWISHSHLTFPSARQVYTYVNRRYVRDKLISHGVLAGYRTLLMHGRYPAAVLFLDVPCEEVDVNVHPAKSEVRFRRSGAVHDFLSHAIQERLRAETPANADVGRSGPSTPDAFQPERLPIRAVAMRLPLRLVEAEGEPSSSPPGPAECVAEPPADTGGFFASLRVVGQVFEGYFICENGDELVLIDQHAAHERVTFERLRGAYRRGVVQRQRLLLPTVVEFGPEEAAVLAEHAEGLESLGFEIEPYGAGSFAVRAVPALLGARDPGVLLRETAEELADVGRSRRLDEAAEAVLARLACHAAVRVGHGMGTTEVRALLAEMDRVDFSGNCPHGRPAFVRVGRGELERWFKRT